VRDPKAKPRKRYDGTASRVISTGVFVALEALPFQIISDFGKLCEAGLEVFDDLKLARCPRSLAPTLVTFPSMSLVPSLHSAAMMSVFATIGCWCRFTLYKLSLDYAASSI